MCGSPSPSTQRPGSSSSASSASLTRWAFPSRPSQCRPQAGGQPLLQTRTDFPSGGQARRPQRGGGWRLEAGREGSQVLCQSRLLPSGMGELSLSECIACITRSSSHVSPCPPSTLPSPSQASGCRPCLPAPTPLLLCTRDLHPPPTLCPFPPSALPAHFPPQWRLGPYWSLTFSQTTPHSVLTPHTPPMALPSADSLLPLLHLQPHP